MKLFLTGATGFVGGSLMRACLERGDDVTALIRPSSESSRMSHERLTWVEGDVTDRDSLRGLMAGHDAVIHAAGKLGQFGISEQAYDLLHVHGSLNVLDEAEQASVPRILYVSSPGVLGPTNDLSLPPKDETARYGPTNRYERSKARAEEAVRERIRSGAPVVIVRPEFMYGPGDLHVLALFGAIQSGKFFLINQGRSHCHPTYIDDGVQGMLLTLDQGEIGEIYHIAGQTSVPFQAFAAEIGEATDGSTRWFSLPRWLMRPAAGCLEMLGPLFLNRPPLTRSAVDFFSTSYRFSWEKARQELGYNPAIDLKTGIQRTVSWYRQEGLLE